MSGYSISRDGFTPNARASFASVSSRQNVCLLSKFEMLDFRRSAWSASISRDQPFRFRRAAMFTASRSCRSSGSKAATRYVTARAPQSKEPNASNLGAYDSSVVRRRPSGVAGTQQQRSEQHEQEVVRRPRRRSGKRTGRRHRKARPATRGAGETRRACGPTRSRRSTHPAAAQEIRHTYIVVRFGTETEERFSVTRKYLNSLHKNCCRARCHLGTVTAPEL